MLGQAFKLVMVDVLFYHAVSLAAVFILRNTNIKEKNPNPLPISRL